MERLFGGPSSQGGHPESMTVVCDVSCCCFDCLLLSFFPLLSVSRETALRVLEAATQERRTKQFLILFFPSFRPPLRKRNPNFFSLASSPFRLHLEAASSTPSLSSLCFGFLLPSVLVSSFLLLLLLCGSFSRPGGELATRRCGSRRGVPFCLFRKTDILRR